jgi:hypothetical protein
MTSPLGPPGTFTSFEAADRAAGFHIPRIPDNQGWRAETIEVTGPESASVQLVSATVTAADKVAIANFRSVHVTYLAEGARSAEAGSTFDVVFYRTDLPLKPIGNAGEAKSVQIDGREAVIQQSHLTGISMVSVQSKNEGIMFSALAGIVEPESRRVQLGPQTLTLERFLALLAAMH